MSSWHGWAVVPVLETRAVPAIRPTAAVTDSVPHLQNTADTIRTVRRVIRHRAINQKADISRPRRAVQELAMPQATADPVLDSRQGADQRASTRMLFCSSSTPRTDFVKASKRSGPNGTVELQVQSIAVFAQFRSKLFAWLLHEWVAMSTSFDDSWFHTSRTIGDFAGRDL